MPKGFGLRVDTLEFLHAVQGCLSRCCPAAAALSISSHKLFAKLILCIPNLCEAMVSRCSIFIAVALLAAGVVPQVASTRVEESNEDDAANIVAGSRIKETATP